jgi:hypothetical protein
MSVIKYRIYCITEGGWVYSFREAGDEPTMCINNTSHTVNPQSVQIIELINSNNVDVKNQSKNTFEDQITVTNNPIIDLKSFMGVSELRNIVTITGNNSSITNNIGGESEINLTIGQNIGDSASLQSIERGQYISGTMCEVGLGIRIPEGALSGTQSVKYGYFDNNNGFYFKKTENEFECCILNDGVETSISRNSFNVNRLDGTEANMINLNFAKGNIFRILFSWYGYGVVRFGVVAIDSDNIQKMMIFHNYETNGSTSTLNPNLPIKVVLDAGNSDGTSNSTMYVAGRQFSVYGNESRVTRLNSHYRYNVASTTSILPIVSFKKKQYYEACKVQLMTISIVSSVDTILTVCNNATLVSSNFIENIYASESALLVDISSVSYTNGHIVYSEIIFANIPIRIVVSDYTNIGIYENNPLTFSCKNINYNGTISVSCQMSEYW